MPMIDRPNATFSGEDGGNRHARRRGGVLAAVLLGACLLAGGAQAASDRLSVPLPDLSGIDRDEGLALLAELADVNVITSNCPDYEISDGEWMLITGTGDSLAAQLGLDPTTYERDFYGPAFALLDDADACERVGPKARPLIRKLIEMGGETELTP